MGLSQAAAAKWNLFNSLQVEGKGKGKVTPLQARLWPRGGGEGRGIALLFQDLGARRG